MFNKFGLYIVWHYTSKQGKTSLRNVKRFPEYDLLLRSLLVNCSCYSNIDLKLTNLSVVFSSPGTWSLNWVLVFGYEKPGRPTISEWSVEIRVMNMNYLIFFAR